MRDAEQARRQEVLLRRLSALGLSVRPLPDGQGVAVTLPLGPERFELPGGGSARFEQVGFATVGGDRIKCVRPLPFFYLPLIRVGGCATAPEFEARIRAAWRARILDLVRTRNWLEKLGLSPAAENGDAPVLRVPLGLGDTEAGVRLFEPGRMILPGCGPLTGVRLRRAEDRIFLPSPSLASGLDIELAISTRLEELARLDARLAREQRVSSAAAPAPSPLAGIGPRLLLVGPVLFADRALHESFRHRGYTLLLARTERDAIRTFDEASPDVVIAETELGRFEGIELIPELRIATGVEHVPVVLVDANERPDRREEARRAGAAGYLVRPIATERIAGGLASLVRNPRRRRFRRYAKRLAAQPPDVPRPDVVSDIGRGGMFVWTQRPVDLRSVGRWTVTLPELATRLEVSAEVLHARTVPGSARRGLGLRFVGFEPGGEALLIRYLRALDSGT